MKRIIFTIIFNLFFGFVFSQTNISSPYCSGTTFGNTQSQIRKVTIANLDNASSVNTNNATYTYFNNLEPVSLELGENPISIVVNRADCAINSLLIFIDLNNNHSFEYNELVGFAEEEVINASHCGLIYPPSEYHFNINIPYSTENLNSRMRIIFSNLNDEIISCPSETSNQNNNFSNGEIEDYDVVINNLSTQTYKNNISVYPNPCSDKINIVIPENLLINKIQLIDQLGRLVKEFEKISFIDTTGLSQGCYFLKYSNENNELSTTFLKL